MSILKPSITVSFFTLLSRVFGYLRDILIASSLGTSILADIYVIAFRLPNFFRRLFAEGAFSAAFVPIYSNKIYSNHREAKLFSNKVFTLLAIVLFIITSLMLIFMEKVIYYTAPGLRANQEMFNLTVTLSRITMPYLIFICLVAMIGGILNSAGKFWAAAASPIFLNLCMIIGILLSLKTKIIETPTHGLCYAIFLAGLVQLLLIGYSAKKIGLLPKFAKINIDDDIRNLAKNMVPGIIGSGIVQINMFIDTIIASMIGTGANIILYYTERLIQLPLGLIGTALGTVLLPLLSKYFKAKDLENAYKTQAKSIEAALILTLPCCAALLFFSAPITNILFERGSFSSLDTISVANTIKAAVVGLPAFILIKIITPSFFANFDTKTPVKIAFISVIINITLNLCFMNYLGYVGIALATSIAAWINVFMLLHLAKKQDLLRFSDVFLNRIKIIILINIFLSFIFFISNDVYKIFIDSAFLIRLLLFFIVCTFSVIIYTILLSFYKIFDLKELALLLSKK